MLWTSHSATVGRETLMKKEHASWLNQEFLKSSIQLVQCDV